MCKLLKISDTRLKKLKVTSNYSTQTYWTENALLPAPHVQQRMRWPRQVLTDGPMSQLGGASAPHHFLKFTNKGTFNKKIINKVLQFFLLFETTDFNFYRLPPLTQGPAYAPYTPTLFSPSISIFTRCGRHGQTLSQPWSCWCQESSLSNSKIYINL